MIIAAYIPNLFDRSRFDGALRDQVRFVEDATSLTDLRPDVVIVDLDRCHEAAAFVLADARTIGFGSHVDTETHQLAREAGFDDVSPRSTFFRRLPGLLTDLEQATGES